MVFIWNKKFLSNFKEIFIGKKMSVKCYYKVWEKIIKKIITFFKIYWQSVFSKYFINVRKSCYFLEICQNSFHRYFGGATFFPMRHFYTANWRNKASLFPTQTCNSKVSGISCHFVWHLWIPLQSFVVGARSTRPSNKIKHTTLYTWMYLDDF